MSNTEHFQLVKANKENVIQLMTWFTDQRSTLRWSGTHFRYPFSEQPFAEKRSFGFTA